MLKTNKVIDWTVVTKNGTLYRFVDNRKDARALKNAFNIAYKHLAPFRIAKTVVTK